MRDWRGPVPTLDEFDTIDDDTKKRLPPRRQQREGYERALQISDGSTCERITVADVTPGGGKSLLALIMALVLLRSGRMERVGIIVPRDGLRKQMEELFDRFGLPMAVVTSETISEKVLRAHAGFITTYQAINKSPAKFVAATRHFKMFYILDEFHHLCDGDEEGRGWKPGIATVTENGDHLLCMSGGLGRDDGKPVMFVDYGHDRKPKKHIVYTRRDALAEEAIVELRLDLHNGDTVFQHRGSVHEVELATAPSRKKARQATRTALELDDFRLDLLGRAFQAWLDYRLDHGGYRSQFIVICDSQAGARNAAKWLNERDSRFDIGLAISDEGVEATRAMKRFRQRAGTDILVTCQMAYEGLDAPFATHLAYMTKIRSIPWMDQAFARITRFNHKCPLSWRQQTAYAFAPCDPMMQKYAAELQREQDDRYREREQGPGNGAPYARRSSFSPLSAEPTDIMVAGEHGMPPREVQEMMWKLRGEFPGTQAWSAQELERLARRFMVDERPR